MTGTAGGIDSWPTPDSTATAGPRLDGGLQIVLLEARPDGWAQIECSNGWRAWVDASLLEPMAPAGAALAASLTPAPAPAPAVAPNPPLDPSAITAPVAIGGIKITAPLIGGAVIVVATILPWVSFGGVVTENALGVPLQILFDPKTTSTGGFKIGYLVVVLGGLVVAAALGRVPPHVGRIAGGVAAAIAALFAVQLQRSIGGAQAGLVFSVLGLGVYLTLAGGVVVAMSKRWGAEP